jgi:BirA family biotin operon repressor/biotin-[acetyl-CoA-carboxylase] ligase
MAAKSSGRDRRVDGATSSQMTSSYADLNRPPLHVAGLRRALITPDSLWRHLDVVQSTGSTNADLRDAAQAGAASGTVLVAEEQTAGRGRLQRTWSAPPRSSLTMSVLLRPPSPSATPLGWVPLLAALAIDDALRTCELSNTRVKWPNDVMVGEGKIAGVLSERVDTDGSAAVIVGMGINVSMRLDERPSPAATSLAILGEMTDREVLLKAVLRALSARYLQFTSGEVEDLHRTYLERSGTIGQQVLVDLPGGKALTGRATDIDHSGALVIHDGVQRHLVAAADVTHVRPTS